MISGRLIRLREGVAGSGQAWRHYAAEVTVVVIGVLIATVAELDWINAAMVLNANPLLDRYHALGEDYPTPPEILADAKEGIADLRKGNRATYGPCADVDACFRIDPRYR